MRPRTAVKLIRGWRGTRQKASFYLYLLTHPRVLDVKLKCEIWSILRAFDEEIANRWWIWSGLQALSDRHRRNASRVRGA